MSLLNPTRAEHLVDPAGRPYFLWDVDMTLEEFRARLNDADPDVRAYLVGKLMRQAKPDDVFQFVRLDDVVALWPRLSRHLGKSRSMWERVLEQWGVLARGRE